MKYTCWGAAKQVTGSMHLLELESGYKILVDCGIDYEDKDNKEINAHFPFNPRDIDVLLLTHAHIDHSGNIPNLVKQVIGYFIGQYCIMIINIFMKIYFWYYVIHILMINYCMVLKLKD